MNTAWETICSKPEGCCRSLHFTHKQDPSHNSPQSPKEKKKNSPPPNIVFKLFSPSLIIAHKGRIEGGGVVVALDGCGEEHAIRGVLDDQDVIGDVVGPVEGEPEGHICAAVEVLPFGGHLELKVSNGHLVSRDDGTACQLLCNLWASEEYLIIPCKHTAVHIVAYLQVGDGFGSPLVVVVRADERSLKRVGLEEQEVDKYLAFWGVRTTQDDGCFRGYHLEGRAVQDEWRGGVVLYREGEREDGREGDQPELGVGAEGTHPPLTVAGQVAAL